MTKTGSLNHFWQEYELIGTTKSLNNEIPSFRSCRFCGNDETKTTFKTDSHACPELLGENDFICFEECDECNKKFSAYETHLSTLVNPYMTMAGIKGKKKIPEFHSRTIDRDEETRTIIRVASDGHRQILIGAKVEDDCIIDNINSSLLLKCRLRPFRPLNVYKALVKVGLTLLPDDLVPYYKNSFNWLLKKSENVYIPICFITLLHKKKFVEPLVELYKAKLIYKEEGFYPELTLVVNFGNLIFQIFLPESDEHDYLKSNGQSPILEIYPASIYNNDFTQSASDELFDKVNFKYKFISSDLRSESMCLRDEIIPYSFGSVEMGNLD